MRNRTPLRLVLPIATLSLLGCARTSSDPSRACPPIVSYDDAFQNHVADELMQLPADAAMDTLVADYMSLRDQLRACRGEK
jgi:hypothetical protein